MDRRVLLVRRNGHPSQRCTSRLLKTIQLRVIKPDEDAEKVYVNHRNRV